MYCLKKVFKVLQRYISEASCIKSIMYIPNTVLGVKVHKESNGLVENGRRVHQNPIKCVRSASVLRGKLYY